MTEQLKSYYKSVREITEGTFNKSSGMYLGEQNNPDCKENKNILLTCRLTDNYQDTITVKTKSVYKRRTAMKDSDGTIAGWHEIGEPKFKKVLKRIPFMSIRNAWEMAFDYPTVSYGLAFWRREVLICDSDIEYSSIQEAEKIVDSFTATCNFPKASYIIRNPKTKHIQFGWFLDTPFYSKDFHTFNKAIKTISLLWTIKTGFEADKCFNGPACKNCYYEGFESIIRNELAVNTIEFVKALSVEHKKLLSSLSVVNTVSSTSYTNNTNGTKNYTKQKQKAIYDKATIDSSRNEYLRHYLLMNIWQFMRSHNDNRPGSEWIYAEADRLAEEAATHTGKPKQTQKEIKDTIKSVSRFAFNHYKDNWKEIGKDSGKTEKARNVSKLVRQSEKFIKLVSVLSGEKIKLPKSTLSRYRNIKKAEAENLYLNVLEFYSYARSIQKNCMEVFSSDDQWTELCNEIQKTVLKVKSNETLSALFVVNTVSSSSYTDNTNGTLQTESLPYDTVERQKERMSEVTADIQTLRNCISDCKNNPCMFYSRMPVSVWGKYASTWNDFQKTEIYKEAVA